MYVFHHLEWSFGLATASLTARWYSLPAIKTVIGRVRAFALFSRPAELQGNPPQRSDAYIGLPGPICADYEWGMDFRGLDRARRVIPVPYEGWRGIDGVAL
jgi:hypothetical protein